MSIHLLHSIQDKKKGHSQIRRHSRMDVCAAFVDNTLLSEGDVSA